MSLGRGRGNCLLKQRSLNRNRAWSPFCGRGSSDSSSRSPNQDIERRLWLWLVRLQVTGCGVEERKLLGVAGCLPVRRLGVVAAMVAATPWRLVARVGEGGIGWRGDWRGSLFLSLWLRLEDSYVLRDEVTETGQTISRVGRESREHRFSNNNNKN